MIVIAKSKDKASKENYWREPGSPYFVYAITYPEARPDDVKYAINVSGANVVYDIPASNFNIVDDSIPEDWKVGNYQANGEKFITKTFPEWAHDSSFYEKLWDNNEQAQAIFKKYAQKYEDLAQQYKS